MTKPKAVPSWQAQDEEEGSAKPKEGLALLLDRPDQPNLHLASMVMMTSSPVASEFCTEAELQRTLNYILDANSNSLALPSLTQNGALEIDAIAWYLQQRLDVLCSEGQKEGDLCQEDLLAAGKVGPSVVQMQTASASGEISFDDPCLVLESLSNFSSARANSCAVKGRWMYEATLSTAGIQQLGWATLQCPFTNEEGVGDALDSYAIDGKRVRKWNKSYQGYGQAWMPGDVIGCCIDLDEGEISFLRNGVSLGIAFTEVRRLQPGLGYFPALSLSHGERCELNFGARPFQYPVPGFLPFQSPPTVRRFTDTQSAGTIDETVEPGREPFSHQSATLRAEYILDCLKRLVQLRSPESSASSMATGDSLPRPNPLRSDEQVLVVSTLCNHLGPLLLAGGLPKPSIPGLAPEGIRAQGGYIVWAALLPFLLALHRPSPPHNVDSLELALDLLLVCLEQHEIEGVVSVLMEALAYKCRTARYLPGLYLATGAYPYLALACRLVQRPEVLQMWWTSYNFESSMEGLLFRKAPNKNDLEELLPVVWWPSCREESCSEVRMKQALQALSSSIAMVEELQVTLCRHLLAYVPPHPAGSPWVAGTPSVDHGGVFGAFLHHLIRRNRGANRNIPPSGLSDNSVLVSAFFVLLRMLSEGLTEPILSPKQRGSDWIERNGVGYFHRGGQRKFPVLLFLRSDTEYMELPRLGGTFSHLSKSSPVSFPQNYEDVRWDDSEVWVDPSQGDGSSSQANQPLSPSGATFSPSSQASALPHEGSRSTGGNLDFGSQNETLLADQGERSGWGREREATSSGRESVWTSGFNQARTTSWGPVEEELVDMLIILYHLGVASNFKQASLSLQMQMQSINDLDEADRQIREGGSSDRVRHLRDARIVYKEEVIDRVRRAAWYRVALFSKWKQEGIYASCVWIVQLLLATSRRGVLFSYVPEFYVETLVDSFHALRRSDPPFAPPAALLQRGLSSLVTFLVTHFNDSRIANPDVRDVLLQSISVLLQYREYVAAFERNEAAREKLPASLLMAFDNRFWIPVSHILLRLCKGASFGGTRPSSNGQTGSECASLVFQDLLKKKCMDDPELLGTFVNRLFNTLNWTVTEFSVAVKEMQDSNVPHGQIPELQQQKCNIMYELSCNLLRILEFLSLQLPHIFLKGAEMNLTRLCELLLFVLSHTVAGPDAGLFDSVQRLSRTEPEKLNKSAILGPIAGTVINLASKEDSSTKWDIVRALAHVDSSAQCVSNFVYLVNYNWAKAFKGDPSLVRLPELKAFVKRLEVEVEVVRQAALDEEKRAEAVRATRGSEEEVDLCSICYACEIDTSFLPCRHQSCQRCISRHLLNSSRCFFCNAAIDKLCPITEAPGTADTAELQNDDVKPMQE